MLQGGFCIGREGAIQGNLAKAYGGFRSSLHRVFDRVRRGFGPAELCRQRRHKCIAAHSWLFMDGPRLSVDFDSSIRYNNNRFDNLVWRHVKAVLGPDRVKLGLTRYSEGYRARAGEIRRVRVRDLILTAIDARKGIAADSQHKTAAFFYAGFECVQRSLF